MESWAPLMKGFGLATQFHTTPLKRLSPPFQHVIVALVYMVIGLVIAGQFVDGLYSPTLLYPLLMLQTIRLMRQPFSSSLALVTGVSFLVLYAVYGPNLLIFSGIDPSLTIAMFIVFSDVIKKYSDSPFPYVKEPKIEQHKTIYWLGLTMSCIAITTVYAFVQRSDLGLIVPLGCALFFQEALLRNGAGKTGAFIALGMVELALAVYLLLLWSGFGRLVIASLLLLPFATHSAYHPTILRFWHFVVALPVLIAVATVVRGGSIEDVTSSKAGGVTDHMLLTADLQSGFLVGSGKVQSFIDQYLLFFLNWFPREIWSGKPIGAGAYAVDVFWGRAHYGEEHNVSLGFVGDQIFALGHWYMIGLFVILVTIVCVRRLLIHYSPIIHKSPLIAFDTMLLTFFWGGMASFGSRVWFAVAPLVILALLSKALSRKPETHPHTPL